MPRVPQHGALGFEDVVFATALLVVVVDDEDGEGFLHGSMEAGTIAREASEWSEVEKESADGKKQLSVCVRVYQVMGLNGRSVGRTEVKKFMEVFSMLVISFAHEFVGYNLFGNHVGFFQSNPETCRKA